MYKYEYWPINKRPTNQQTDRRADELTDWPSKQSTNRLMNIRADGSTEISADALREGLKNKPMDQQDIQPTFFLIFELTYCKTLKKKSGFEAFFDNSMNFTAIIGSDNHIPIGIFDIQSCLNRKPDSTSCDVLKVFFSREISPIPDFTKCEANTFSVHFSLWFCFVKVLLLVCIEGSCFFSAYSSRRYLLFYGPLYRNYVFMAYNYQNYYFTALLVENISFISLLSKKRFFCFSIIKVWMMKKYISSHTIRHIFQGILFLSLQPPAPLLFYGPRPKLIFQGP